MSTSPKASSNQTGNVRLERSLVLFMDILGFRAAAKGKQSRSDRLLELLADLSSWQGPFQIEHKQISPKTSTAKARLAISTFSDNIVISYPMSRKFTKHFTVQENTAMALGWMTDMAAQIVVQALDLGLLARGGVTVGEMHHIGGVVFGEGLIDAYELESKSAIYPRVVASSRVRKALPKGAHYHINSDEDGMDYLDYFARLQRIASRNRPRRWSSDRWADQSLAMIDRQIAEFARAECWREYAKWAWFRKKFAAGLLAGRDSDLFSETVV